MYYLKYSGEFSSVDLLLLSKWKEICDYVVRPPCGIADNTQTQVVSWLHLFTYPVMRWLAQLVELRKS